MWLNWNGEETFQLKTQIDKYTCVWSFQNLKVTTKWLANTLVNGVKEQPQIKVSSIQENIQRKYVMKISRSKAYRAKRKGIELVKGNHAEQYEKLWDYCGELLRGGVKFNVCAYDCLVNGE